MKVFGLHVLLVLLLLPSATAALPSATAALQCEHPGRGVCDPDGLLSVREAKQLTAQIVQLEEQFPHDCGDVRRGFQVAVHIIQKLPHGTKKREHARDLFNRHGVGYQLCSRPCTRLRHRTTTFCEILQSNNGLLLLLAVDDRKATIHTGKGTQRVITDLMVTDMLAATGFKQQMRAHDYAGGVQYILDQIAGPLQQNQPTEHYKRRHEAAVSSAAAAVAAAAAAAVSASSFVISTNSSPSISILDSALALFFFFLFFGFGISAVRGHWQSVQPLDSVASFGGEDGWGGVLIVVLVMCLGMCEVFRYSEYVGMVVSAVAGAAAVAAATETTTVASFAFVVLACLRFAYFEWHKFKRDGDFRAKLQRLQDIRVKQLHRRELCKGYTRGRNAKRDGDVTWAADPAAPDGSLRQRYAEDFRRYDMVQKAVHHVTNFFTLNWFGSEISMYAPQTGFGILNPLNIIPLYTVCRWVGISQEWWDIVYTPHYTASFLTDKLDNMCAVTAPLIEVNIPLNPTPENSQDRVLTTCETWADAGEGIRDVFRKLTERATVHTNTRVLDVKNNDDGTKTVYDEHGRSTTVDKVVFACQVSAIGNMHKSHNWIEDTLLSTPEYADDWHPGTGHMHAIIHNDGEVCPEEFREDWLQNGSNYVEISKDTSGKINIENTYNFGVQSPGIKWMQDIPASERPPMLISHALTEGKSIDPTKIVGEGNHSRAHPLYSGWNIMTMLSLRLAQGRQGFYYCANWTTPGNTHDMSCLSGIVAAHAIGADYPFEGEEATEAKKDFERLRGLMGM